MTLRSFAKQQGCPTYPADRPCPKGHMGLRYTSTGWCVTCAVMAGQSKATDDRYKAIQRLGRIRVKSQVLVAFGSKCSCCSESHSVFLCLDHKNGGGNAQRKLIRGHKTGSLYRWVLRRIDTLGIRVVRRDFRLLCWNCNAAHAILGYCPHKRRPSGGRPRRT